jgi:5-formyltetrahydrofolate cyclo-ligase
MKGEIRKAVLQKRDAIPAVVKREKDVLVRELVLSMPEFASAKTIIYYAAFRSEVGTRTLMEESLMREKRIVLPKVNTAMHTLMLYEVKHMDELTPGYMGIPEPPQMDERRVGIDDVDLVVIPGAGFDFAGNRLGYGAGYYDSLLSQRKKNIPVIALAYEEQIVDSIPAETHDVKVDMIVTDKRVIRTALDSSPPADDGVSQQ